MLKIGEVWKAKSPLELFDLLAGRITQGEIDRFLSVAHDILLTPDPALDLPADQRWAASVYGKARLQSGRLIESLCDNLAKLSVWGADMPGISGRIAVFVHELFHNADGTRWLSLSALLPALAEAAPNEFLSAIEASLAIADAPVTQLFTETSSAGVMGRCWYAGLLWALESLAWAPERMPRVALVLANLARSHAKSTWSNSPGESLFGIFRSWLPQTTASVDRRIAAIDLLIAREEDVAFDLLCKLVDANQPLAQPSQRPTWRNDDIGAGQGVTRGEMHRMVEAATERLFSCARGNPHRVARLIELTHMPDTESVQKSLVCAEDFTGPTTPDEEKEAIRAVLRKKLHWHRKYDQMPSGALAEMLHPAETFMNGFCRRT